MELFNPKNRYIGHQGGLWKIKSTNIGQRIFFEFFFFEVFFRHWKGMTLWVKFHLKKITTYISLKKKIKKNLKNFDILHHTFWIFLDLDLKFVYFITQNNTVTQEWNRANYWDPLLIKVSMLNVYYMLPTTNSFLTF